MVREIVRSLILSAATFVICAVAYPAAVWGIASVVFPHQASGSLIKGRDGTIVGSELIAQKFTAAKYFHARPSAVDYKADATGGSNLGPNHPDLRKAVKERAQENGATEDRKVPVDLVTASGSGVDPHVTPESAAFQVTRVAKARGIDESRVRELVERNSDRSWGAIGAPARVNVLKLNIALDELSAAR